MTAIEQWLGAVLPAVQARSGDDFAGVGLLFYSDRSALPVHPLVAADLQPVVPAVSQAQCIELLANISRRASVCHDGFHLVQATTLTITDVSQFLSPPIPAKPLPLEQPGGARNMAARLASLLPSVALVAVFTSPSEVMVYQGGHRRRLAVCF
ncbi:hypothetical protein bcgnr5379_60590 [Bacillus cereus]|uniref:hypothetical protein n=1 Tax=Bacteria TaxID=2 RepID=UPI0011AB761B|nr:MULTISPECIES: hypothetical protein [Bacteria]MDT0923729.1 hypothetical protein [Staphylococcus pseudintermedius]